MIRLPSSALRSCSGLGRRVWLVVLAWGILAGGGGLPWARAALQFDAFVGYDDIVHEGGWFPVGCEVFNDGPTFQATFEISSEAAGRSQTRQVNLELPTNTRKRFVIPAFASAGRYGNWNARLLDERGRVRAERLNLRPKDKAWDAFLMGAVPRSFGGLPGFPDFRNRQEEFLPKVARLQVEFFPDNPIELEGLNALYLNSEKALDLKDPQRQALLAWLYGGGHLIVAVEQPTDVTGTPWLNNLAPLAMAGVSVVKPGNEMQDWVRLAPGRESAADPGAGRRPGRIPPRNPTGAASVPLPALTPDPVFDAAEIPVAGGTLRDGQVILAINQTALVIQARRGRGKITLLTFSPEREPFRSWKNRAWFWSRVCNLPSAAFTAPEHNRYGGSSIDGVIGAMIDSRQVRKLPVTWLLVLLGVYLVVIGPLDHYWLKRINKQMWTWVTFPVYVAVFSGLIYFIGYKLRAGESEWNELSVIDVLPRGEGAELRGRTFASVYSPVNARYELASDQPYATLRGEFQGSWGGGQESSRANVEQRGKGFRAEIFVPVWTCQLFVSDWMQPAEAPVRASITAQGGRLVVVVENRLGRKLTEARLVWQGKIFELGELAAQQTKTVLIEIAKDGRSLSQFVEQYRQHFFDAVQQRRQALGSDRGGRLEKNSAVAMAACFVSQLDNPRPDSRFFMAPHGFDATPLLAGDDAVLFAWAGGQALSAPLHRFTPRRTQRDTLLRLAVPLGGD